MCLASTTPAKVVFRTVSVILTIIRVSFHLVRNYCRVIRHDTQDSIINEMDHIERVGLQNCPYRPRPGVEGEAVERTQQCCARGDQFE